jgi:hypothetical protein
MATFFREVASSVLELVDPGVLTTPLPLMRATLVVPKVTFGDPLVLPLDCARTVAGGIGAFSLRLLWLLSESLERY